MHERPLWSKHFGIRTAPLLGREDPLALGGGTTGFTQPKTGHSTSQSPFHIADIRYSDSAIVPLDVARARIMHKDAEICIPGGGS
jgi:hypothetical protein